MIKFDINAYPSFMSAGKRTNLGVKAILMQYKNEVTD